MILQLDLESETPIYMQIKQQIMEGIALRSLVPGEPLPSVRSLAADLGINMHTVNKAYKLLKQDGYILIHRQKGVVVHPDGVPPADAEFLQGLQGDLRPLITEAVCRGMEKEQFIKKCKDIFAQFERERGNE
ncbi:MAG TPA: GntR family transcriptional regulator [Bacillales bacterium]